MPAKKKDVKHEEPVYVDDEGTFVHEAEGARYKGGIRRYNAPGEAGGVNTATGNSSSAAAGGGNAGPAGQAASGGGGGSARGAGRNASTAGVSNAAANAHGADHTAASNNTNAAANNNNNSAAQGVTLMRYRHGQGVYTSPELRYEGSWVEDQMHGKGRLQFLRSGNCYEGEFVHNAFDGYGVYVWHDGSRYAGMWRDNRMHGEGVYTDAEGNTWKGKYYNGTGPGQERIYRVQP